MRRAVLTVLTLLAGCATYHAQPIAPAQLAHQFEHRSLASDELRAFLTREVGHEIRPWPVARWDRRILTLAAWYYSPALDVARAQWETAKAGVQVADAIPNPVLQLPFQFATPNPGPGAPFIWGPALDIPIEIAGKRGYRVDQASHLSESARLAIGNEAWKVRGQVRDALLALYSARERTELFSRKAQALEQVVRMLEKRRSVGENSGTDVDAAVLVATQAQSDLATAQSARQDALAQLASAIGVPVAAFEDVQLDLDEFATSPAAPPAAEAQRDAVFHRADLLSALADYAAAESALQLEVAKQYPDIHLGTGYTYDTGTHKIGFGIAGITLPIFDQNQGNIAQAEAKRKEAAARTAALQDSILGDLDHALARYRSSLDAVQLSARHLATARRQLDDRAAAFATGDTDRLTFTQAKADFEVSEMTHLDAVVAARQAADALEDAMQRPLEPELTKASLSQQEPR